MSNPLRFGAFRYSLSRNLGDEVQTLAALPFLPSLDAFIDRDLLGTVSTPLHCIFNGWFKHGNAHWPPPPAIVAYFTSFYVQPGARALVDARYRDYYRQFAPIGCRSFATLRTFESIGVDAYFSGCLTLTLTRPPGERGDAVLIVDADASLLRRAVPWHVMERAVFLSHHYVPGPLTGTLLQVIQELPRGYQMASAVEAKLRPATAEERNRRKLAAAAQRLRAYATARLVITGKLHVALPCLAMGTPVLFLYEGYRLDARLEGLSSLVRCVDSGDAKAPIDFARPEPNSEDFRPLATALANSTKQWVARVGGSSEGCRPWWQQA